MGICFLFKRYRRLSQEIMEEEEKKELKVVSAARELNERKQKHAQVMSDIENQASEVRHTTEEIHHAREAIQHEKEQLEKEHVHPSVDPSRLETAIEVALPTLLLKQAIRGGNDGKK